MTAPLIRRFTRAAPGALDVFAFCTDDDTNLTFLQVNRANKIRDVVNDPDPAAGLRYQTNIFRNTQDTNRKLFSTSLSSASAGRVAIGPIDISPAQYQFSTAQRAGALTAYSFIVKLDSAFG